MKRSMVRVRERNQITLPGTLLEGINVQVGDFLEVTLTSAGLIQLTPTRLVAVDTPAAEAHESEAGKQVASGNYKTFGSAKEFGEDLKQRSQKREKAARVKVAEVAG